MNWNDGITEFGFDCKVRKLSPKTISNYTKQLWYFQRFVKAEFNQIKTVHIKLFLSSMDDKGIIVFKTFLHFLFSLSTWLVKNSFPKFANTMKN